jgi:hypothetical protein
MRVACTAVSSPNLLPLTSGCFLQNAVHSASVSDGELVGSVFLLLMLCRPGRGGAASARMPIAPP